MQPDRLSPQCGIGLVERQVAQRRGKVRPFRRTQAADAPALLIDQDRHVVASGQVTQTVGERAHLSAIDAVAAKQDDAAGERVRKAAAVHVGQAGAGDVEDEGGV